MKHIHFIAIGGAVMHQLALVLQKQGNKISGSDDEINDPARANLKRAALLPASYGWYPEKITTDIDAIVLGMHAKADNPELIAAQKLNIPIFSFPEYIYEVSKNKKRIVVAGSHGKTTITSMVMHVLQHYQVDFDYLVGAKLAGFDNSIRLSDAPLIVLEGDEYPASVIEKRPKIFFYEPDVSVLSGIAWDHINVFPTAKNYRNQFETYLKNMRAGALLFYNDADKKVSNVVAEYGGHLHAVPYNMPQYHYRDGVPILETEQGNIEVSVFGSHNLLNMQAALAVCVSLGISEEKFYDAIKSFTGAARRLEQIYEDENLIAFRDFAHAPSKLKATLEAVREAYPMHELIACFELHTFSSLNEKFLSEYAHSMDAPDKSIIYFSHHALQLKNLPRLHTDIIKKYFARNDAFVFDKKELLTEKINSFITIADRPVCLLIMSSGTFDGIDWNELVSR